MTCHDVRENFWGYFHRQIPDDLARSMQSHLETCSACVAELQQFKQVDGALDGFESIEPSPYFALLAKLAQRHDLPGLSMGMSDDYRTAIMIGATQIRVGTDLFGPRD